MTGEYDIETPALRVNVYRHSQLVASDVLAPEPEDTLAEEEYRAGPT